jgi:secreted trypsin-like serine protease
LGFSCEKLEAFCVPSEEEISKGLIVQRFAFSLPVYPCPDSGHGVRKSRPNLPPSLVFSLVFSGFLDAPGLDLFSAMSQHGRRFIFPFRFSARITKGADLMFSSKRKWLGWLLSLGLGMGAWSCGEPIDQQEYESQTDAIVGGHTSQAGSRPYQIALYKRINGNWKQWCGGTLLNANWVLTAAHCTKNTGVNRYRVRVGVYTLSNASQGHYHNVARKIEHPNYNGSTHNNDICLLKLATPANVQHNWIKPALLPTQAIINQHASPGDNVTVSGWGKLRERATRGSNTLQEVRVPIVSNQTCNAPVAYDGRITNNMLCAGFSQGGKDSCQGDSGGPVVVRVNNKFYNVGVVSWGEGCARPNRYGVYVRTINFVNWIKSKIGGGGTPPAITLLKNNVAKTGQSRARHAWAKYAIDLPQGASNLVIKTSGGSGDADMYTRFKTAPTKNVYDCRPYKQGNNETCKVASPSAGRYYVYLYAYRKFSGLRIKASYTKSGGGGSTTILKASTDTPLNIPDGNANGVVSSIKVNSSKTATKVEAVVKVTHPYIGALRLRLRCPNGKTVTLHNYTGGGSSNINRTYHATACDNQPASGTWKLRANDKDNEADNGKLDRWKIKLKVK